MGEKLEVPSEEEEHETYFEQPLIEESEILEEHYISCEESIMVEEGEGEYTISMARKIGLEEVGVEVEVEIGKEEGVEVEETKILLDFLLLIKIKTSQ